MAIGVLVSLATAFLLLVEVIIYKKEQSLGKRIFLVQTRSHLDRFFSKALFFLREVRVWLIQHVLKATWHRTAYTFLRSLQGLLHRLYFIVEEKLHLNRKRLHDIKMRSKKSKEGGLSEITAHKKATSLSDEEKTRIRRDTLE